jgi:hypothetical protein
MDIYMPKLFRIVVPVERLTDALLALDHDPRKDISYQEFLTKHELSETVSALLDFEHFALIVLEYEEKLRIEEEALRRLDLKIAFECFDINKGNFIMSFVLFNLVLYRWYD